MDASFSGDGFQVGTGKTRPAIDFGEVRVGHGEKQDILPGSLEITGVDVGRKAVQRAEHVLQGQRQLLVGIIRLVYRQAVGVFVDNLRLGRIKG